MGDRVSIKDYFGSVVDVGHGVLLVSVKFEMREEGKSGGRREEVMIKTERYLCFLFLTITSDK